MSGQNNGNDPSKDSGTIVSPGGGIHPLENSTGVQMRNPGEIHKKINMYKSRIDDSRNMIHHFMRDGDWHGVEDFGSDIRDCLAAISALEWVLGEN